MNGRRKFERKVNLGKQAKDVIARLEEQIGSKLAEIPIYAIMSSFKNAYTLDERGHITGLNLNKTGLPDISAIAKLFHLIYLDLGSNQIADISPLQHLIALRELRLPDNQIADISPLQSLTALTVLHLSGNQIADISPLQSLTALTGLHLSGNQIADISPLQSLTALTGLHLSGNQIADISPLRSLTALTGLHLSDNQISDISPLKPLIDSGLNVKWGFDIGGLILEGNPLEIPPVEIVKQGREAILNYFKEIGKESVRLLQAKLIIVGNGEGGKTTLMKKLKDPNFRVKIGKEETTHGINIEEWELQCPFPGGDSDTVNVHFWDFGGQDIYHATHQFFLTKRSLYLFVWEARKEDEARSFDYWLNIIKLLSAESPVIVVMNKADMRDKHIDEAGFRDKFPNIVGFHKVSCITGYGINELTEQIRTTLGRMAHLEDKLPKVWLDIRDRLRAEAKNYISLENFFDICRQFGIDERRAEFLSDYLHDLGVILHFRRDALLGNTVILNPEWATEAVYTLIDTREIQENKGRFQLNDLKKYWDLNKFPRDKHAELVRLIEKFELCFPVTGNDIHIVQELLPAKRPDVDFNRYQMEGNLHFEYHYDFMPEGIITRFISRLYYLIKDDHFWKNGAELKFEDSTALVVSELLNRKIKISVTGSLKNEMLAITRNDFDYIHQTLNMEERKHYTEMIPCICAECIKGYEPHLFSHDILKKYVQRNIPSIRCGVSLEEIPVEKLLKGFNPQLLKGFIPQKPKQNLLKTLITTTHHLQGIAKSIKSNEDSRNGFIARQLSIFGFIAVHNAHWGNFASGKPTATIDIKVETADLEPLSIIEAFNLKRLDGRVIDLRLLKLFNYIPSGFKENFVIVYSEAEDFLGLWQKYLNRIPEIDFKYKLLEGLEEQKTPFSGIKLARAKHLRDGEETHVYHIFVNMNRA